MGYEKATFVAYLQVVLLKWSTDTYWKLNGYPALSILCPPKSATPKTGTEYSIPPFTYVASQTLDGIVAQPDKRTAQIIIKVFMVSSPIFG